MDQNICLPEIKVIVLFPQVKDIYDDTKTYSYRELRRKSDPPEGVDVRKKGGLCSLWSIFSFCLLPPSKRSLGQGNIFSSVCQEFCPGGGGIPACPCRFPGPHPGGKLRGLAWGGSPGPHPRGKLRGSGLGVSRPTPGGVVYPSMQWGRPHPPPMATFLFPIFQFLTKITNGLLTIYFSKFFFFCNREC